MEGNAENDGVGRRNHWRIAAWGGAVLLLLLPLLAMQFIDDVNWGVGDFALAAALLLGAGITFEVAVRMTGDAWYRAGVGVALAAAFVLVWLSLGVGIIGRDGDPANFLYFGVLAVAFIGAAMARFRPRGMARALLATALAQVLVAVMALVAGMGTETANWPLDILGLTGFFTVLWLIAAWLFRKTARERPTVT